MGVTIGAVEAMPYPEYRDWQRFYEEEPWGVGALDAMHAHLASLLAEIHRDTKKRRTPYVLKDFLLFGQDRNKPRRRRVPRVQGKTAEQWQLIFAAERYATRQKLGLE